MNELIMLFVFLALVCALKGVEVVLRNLWKNTGE